MAKEDNKVDNKIVVAAEISNTSKQENSQEVIINKELELGLHHDDITDKNQSIGIYSQQQTKLDSDISKLKHDIDSGNLVMPLLTSNTVFNSNNIPTITRASNTYNNSYGYSAKSDDIKASNNMPNTVSSGFSIVLTKGTTTTIDFSNILDVNHAYNFYSNNPRIEAGDATNGQLVGIYENTNDHSITGAGAKFYGQFVGAGKIILTSGNDIFVPSLGNQNSGVSNVDGSQGINIISLAPMNDPYFGTSKISMDILLENATQGFQFAQAAGHIFNTTYTNFQLIEAIHSVPGTGTTTEEIRAANGLTYTKIMTYPELNITSGVHTFTFTRSKDVDGNENMDDYIIWGWQHGGKGSHSAANILFTGSQEVITCDPNGAYGVGNTTLIGDNFAINDIGGSHISSDWAFGSNSSYTKITIASYLDLSGLASATNHTQIISCIDGTGHIKVTEYLAANYTISNDSNDQITITQGLNKIIFVATEGTVFDTTFANLMLGSEADVTTNGLSATDHQRFNQTSVTWDNGHDYINNFNNKTNSTDFWNNFDKQLNDQANAKGNNVNNSINSDSQTNSKAVQDISNAATKPASDNNSANHNNINNEHHNNSSSSNDLDLHAILSAAKNSVEQNNIDHIHNSGFSSIMNNEISHLMQSTYQHDEANSMSYTLDNNIHYDSNSDDNNIVNHTHKENKDHHNH
ncbi:hypothetical protein ACFX5K_02175 [Rickettsiales bacterium LUAb2]